MLRLSARFVKLVSDRLQSSEHDFESRSSHLDRPLLALDKCFGCDRYNFGSNTHQYNEALALLVLALLDRLSQSHLWNHR
ncbi:MAG TPA: hypothetical protein V6C50_13950 [Crinalium sp.]